MRTQIQAKYPNLLLISIRTVATKKVFANLTKSVILREFKSYIPSVKTLSIS